MNTMLLSVLLITMTTTVVLALPDGAPVGACEGGSNIVPLHNRLNNTATGAVPFTVDISDVGNSYRPGINYTIVLRGGTTNTNFRGFMIQGRVMADDSPAGTFDDDESAPDYQIRCNQATAATHTGREEKTMVELLWIAPASGTGAIYFRYAFVDRYEPTNNMNMYWANLNTNSVMESGAGHGATAPIVLVVILTTLLMLLI